MPVRSRSPALRESPGQGTCADLDERLHGLGEQRLCPPRARSNAPTTPVARPPTDLRGSGVSMELHVFVASAEVPGREKWQERLDASNFPTVLAEAFDPAADRGFVPVTFGGAATGFEFSLGDASSITAAYPHAVQRIGGRDLCATFTWSGAVDELASAFSAAASLADLADGVYFDPQDDEFLLGSEAIALGVRGDRVAVARPVWASGVRERELARVLCRARRRGLLRSGLLLPLSCGRRCGSRRGFRRARATIRRLHRARRWRGTNARRQPFEASAKTRWESGSLRGSTRK